MEKAGERRCRFYKLAAARRDALRRQRSFWTDFVRTLDRVAAIKHA